MPLSYKSFNIYQLLCHRRTYELIDDVCKAGIPNWNISRFEREIHSELLDMGSTIDTVMELVSAKLDELDRQYPLLRYLEQGQHVGDELFLTVPDPQFDYSAYYILWAIIAREFSGELLPMDETELRKKFVSIVKGYGINYENGKNYEVDALKINDGWHLDGLVNAHDIRRSLYLVEDRNRAFMKRMECDADKLYIDHARKRFEQHCQLISTQDQCYVLRKDFDAHNMCFAIDSSCTVKQRDYTFQRWGIFTGKPLSCNKAGAVCGVTTERIRQSENTVLRNSVRDRRSLLVLNQHCAGMREAGLNRETD